MTIISPSCTEMIKIKMLFI